MHIYITKHKRGELFCFEICGISTLHAEWMVYIASWQSGSYSGSIIWWQLRRPGAKIATYSPLQRWPQLIICYKCQISSWHKLQCTYYNDVECSYLVLKNIEITSLQLAAAQASLLCILWLYYSSTLFWHTDTHILQAPPLSPPSLVLTSPELLMELWMSLWAGHWVVESLLISTSSTSPPMLPRPHMGDFSTSPLPVSHNMN